MEIKVVRQILEWNEDVSAQIKALLRDKQVFMINIMASPGAGKTTFILDLIGRLREQYRIGVIEGDVAGTVDAEAIGQAGIPVVQLQTDGACHIEAMSIQNILPHFDLDALDLLLVENIGNLVCPAEFNIGEDLRIALLSVPEGDDKVGKYPLLFSICDALLINKYDMLPHFAFDDAKVERMCKDVNPHAAVFRVCARDGQGMADFCAWLEQRLAAKQDETDKHYPQ